jgi:uncharacterized protein (TIGR02001 family)
MGGNFSWKVFPGAAGLVAVCLTSGTFAAAAANSAAAEPLFDVAFGAALTSDYISRGATQSDHEPAFQPRVEHDVKNFYVGYWGSNVSSGGVGDWENDLSIGFRPTVGPVSLDLGYVQYIYSNDLFAEPSGEVYVKGTVNPTEPLTLGAQLYVNPAQTNATYSELNAAYALPHNVKLSGAVGLVTSDDPSFVPWNVGISWNPTEPVTLDARYQAGPTADRVVLTLSLATTVNTLKETAKK